MSETESDDDLMPNIGLQYQHNSRNIIANITNFNNLNATRYTFQNNNKTSTFTNADLQRQRYGMGGYDQRSMYYKRETSPMSLRSFPDSRVENYHNSFNVRGMNSNRSVFNGRSGSPMSMRSVDSNASVSAADIALAFKNVKFNKYDLRLIKEAYNQFMKKRIRKRIEKRRNLKLFYKQNRHKSGDDSGEQGSDSSISSNDCRSTRTFYKENLPISKTLRTDLSNFRNTIKESDILNDCSENLRQNALRNKYAVKNSITHNQTNDRLENTSTVTLKDRFTKQMPFILPSQRFNRSTAKPTNQTLHINQTKNINKNLQHSSKNNTDNHGIDSDNEEIFSGVTTMENIQNTSQRKRVLENDENSSARKRNKVDLSPIKHNETQQNDFNFKKPQLPLRKSNTKRNVAEVLIAKSVTGSLDLDLPMSNESQQQNLEGSQKSEVLNLPPNSTKISDSINQNNTTQNSDVSMRPSFIKRKLFTQKLDVAERKNSSSDNLGINSPQTKIYSECGEKNRVRKLVSSQSCLSRDVLGDDNVLDLIHKIVPPDQMNITSATNKKDTSKSNHNDDRWDVTSVISMCNEKEGSDTYTDEEIFKVPNSKNANTKRSMNETSNKKEIANKQNNSYEEMLKSQCKVIVQKLQPKVNLMSKVEETDPNCQKKRTVSMCVKSFWDTDFESDMDDGCVPWKSRLQTQQANNIQKDTTVVNSNFNLTSKRNSAIGTILTVRSLQNKGLSSSRSDISRVSKRKEPDAIINQEKKEHYNETLNTNSKSKQNNETKISKSKKGSDSSEKNNHKPKGKAKATEKNNYNAQNNNLLNSSKESVKLKQKKEKSNLTVNTAKTKVKPTKTSPKKSNPKNKTNKSEKDVEDSKLKKDISYKRKSNNSEANVKSVNIETKTINKCNTSRESLRLKERKEKLNLSIDTTKSVKSTKPEKTKDTLRNNKQINTKSKETPNNIKVVKNPSIKNATLNRIRQTPRKSNEKKQIQTPLTDQSSLNISNISNRSLRIRRKIVK